MSVIAAETWKPVVGFEGQYEVSDFGRVRSLDRTSEYQRLDQYSGRLLTIRRHHRGHFLQPSASKSGHLSVVLGRGNTRQVHTLVLEAFVGPCPAGHEGCHGDDIPSNNNLSNLRWDTRSANLHDAVRNGVKSVGERQWNAKLKDADIPVIRGLFETTSYAEIARRYGVAESTIRQIRDGRAWTHVKEVQPCA